MYPNYIARKSIVAHISIWLILLSLITYGIPLIFQVFRFISAANYSIEFYNDKITTKKGILARSEYSTVFMGIYSVSVRQSFFGRLFNYGDLYVDCVGKWDVSTKKISDPYALKAYLESQTVRIPPMNRTNVFFNQRYIHILESKQDDEKTDIGNLSFSIARHLCFRACRM